MHPVSSVFKTCCRVPISHIRDKSGAMGLILRNDIR